MSSFNISRAIKADNSCCTWEKDPPIAMHILLFVLAIFWPFLVIGMSVLGVKLKDKFEQRMDMVMEKKKTKKKKKKQPSSVENEGNKNEVCVSRITTVGYIESYH